MAQKTALEWLISKLSTELGKIPTHKWAEIKNVIQEAKQLEKDQIMRDYLGGANDEFENYGGQYIGKKDAEKYYNDTYVSQKTDDTNSLKK